jgi:hypothetical protein
MTITITADSKGNMTTMEKGDQITAIHISGDKTNVKLVNKNRTEDIDPKIGGKEQ